MPEFAGQSAPEQSFKLLRKALPKRLQPFLRGVRKRIQRIFLDLPEPQWTAFPYTQVSPARQENLLRICRLVEERGLSGAVVECGVLDGGAAALMAYATSRSDRPIHLFDAWQGLPPATNKDGPDADKWIGQVVGSPTRVRRVMKKLKVNPARLNFHVGWFDETFGPASERIDRVAVLHIDPDFYEPVKLCLATWFPKVEPGGFVQFDDYGEFEGATRAIDEFLGNNPELKLETYGQGGAAYFIEKPR